MIYRYLTKYLPMKIKQTNKQTKGNTELWVWCLLHSYAHCLTLRDICVLYCKYTNNKSFISGTSTSKIIIFQFFGLNFHLFPEWLELHLFGRALSRSHKLFSCPWTIFLDAFLNKRMAQPTWKSKGIAKCRVEIVIELCAIKIRWKIKFKNKREIHQLVSALHQYQII